MKCALFKSPRSIRTALLACLFALSISGCSDAVKVASDNTDASSNTQIATNDTNDTNGTVDAQSESQAPPVSNVQPSSEVQVPSSTTSSPDSNALPEPIRASLEILPVKTFRINWPSSANAELYRVFENPDGVSGFNLVSEDLNASTRSFDHPVALFNRVNATYVVQACNTNGCVDSSPLTVSGSLDSAIGYFKASNTDADDEFGRAVSLSADGNTLAVGARNESSSATGIDGDQANNLIRQTGAVYVFVRSDGLWQQQAYLKASNSDERDGFGGAVSLSGDGNTLVVAASGENSAAAGVNGDQTDNSVRNSGAVYVFTRSSGLWQQQAYVKASNPGELDSFGSEVSISADGNTLAVSALREDTAATGINAEQTENVASNSGAVYVFVRSNETWQQQAYIKASNTNGSDNFGFAISLSADGNALAVGALLEDSAATGIGGDETNNSSSAAGAVYVFVRNNDLWQQQAYLKASTNGAVDYFGYAVSLDAEGNTLAVGALLEDSGATGVNGEQGDNSADKAGAVYVFSLSNGLWQQQAYLKASNTDAEDRFGRSVSLSADGNTLAVGAQGDSVATGINGDQTDNAENAAGSAYIFVRSSGLWQQKAYVKASNTEDNDEFGISVSLSGDGNSLAIGAWGEESGATGINSDQNDESATDSGAVYLY